MLHRIFDAADGRLAVYAAVGDAQALAREGLFVAEGRLVVERLLEGGRFEIHSIAVTRAAAEALAPALARRGDVTVLVCEPAILEQVTGIDFHRGCLALARRPAEPIPLSQLSRATRVLALEGVGNPDNVGGLFRTAFAFGIDAVMIDPATADPLYRKAIRTSMAATLRVPFLRVEAWIDSLIALRRAGLRLVALTPRPGAIALDEYAAGAAGRVVLLAGSEGPGLSEETLRHADVQVRIPVDARADSLNVVTATAIALYALTVRKGHADQEGN